MVGALGLPALMAVPSLFLTVTLIAYRPAFALGSSFFIFTDTLDSLWMNLGSARSLSDRVVPFSVLWGLAVLVVIAPVVLWSFYRSGSRNTPVLAAAIWTVLALSGGGAVYVVVPALIWVAANFIAAYKRRGTPAPS